MVSKVLISAASVGALVVLTGPALAKEKTKKTAEASHIYTQVECTGKKTMHWDDATKTCQKNK